MSGFQDVMAADELAEGAGACVDLDGRPVAVFRLGGQLFAIDDTCTHAEASLSEGEVSDGRDGPQVECPWHFAAFCLRTGKVLCAPAPEGVATYAVREEDGRILVDPSSKRG